MKKKITLVTVILVAAFGLFWLNEETGLLGGAGGVGARACTVTESVAAVGDDISSTVLSAYSNRAWASIQLPLLASAAVATNTASLSFGGTAALNTGYTLATSTLGTPLFGLNTDFPFVGAVTAITSTGSTTLHVIECRY